MKFTPTQWDIILHRLGAPDAIAEFLHEEHNLEPAIVERHAYQLQGEPLASINSRAFDELETTIIKECVRGSTYFHAIDAQIGDGDISRSKAAYQVKSMYELADMLGIDYSELPDIDIRPA